MSLLRELSGHPEYVRILKNADELRPTIPAWDTENPLSVENWKHKSAMQEGFDLCLLLFKPK